MKRLAVKILILTASLFAKKTCSQNLISNYSFEVVDSCPLILDKLPLAPPWFQPNFFNSNQTSSSDLFNSCSSTSTTNVPNNVLGFQYANSGSGYCGIALSYANIIPNEREYIESALLKPLVLGKKYCVEMYVSLSNNSQFSVSRIGFAFTNDSVKVNQLSPYYFKPLTFLTPQVENDSTAFITDTLNWVLISGNFIANGGERFLTIGNFYNDSRTPYQSTGFGTQPVAYYYIDDVSVTCCDSSGICEEPVIANNELFIPNAFSPNNDGHNDVLRVLGNASKIEFKVFDRWGEMVYSYTGGEMSAGTGWDGTYKGKELDNAVFVYFAKVTLLDGKEVELKGNVSLIK